MRRILVAVAWLLAFQALPVGSAWAAAQATTTQRVVTLSLSDAQRLSLAQAPSFLADRQEGVAARGELRQARVFGSNPQFELDAPGSWSGRGLGEYEARLFQEIEWAGQRGLRIRAAERGVAAADATVLDAARHALREVTIAYYGTAAAEQRLGVAGEILGLTRQLFDASRTQLQQGEISALDANLAGIEYGRARARVLTAQRELTSARLELQRRVGLAPTDSIVLVAESAALPDPTQLEADSIVRVALARRPDLGTTRAALERARAEASLASREVIPNVQLGVVAERRTLDVVPGLTSGAGRSTYEPTRIGLGVSVPVPLWNISQGVREERRARVTQAGFAVAAVELSVRTDVENALRTYRSAAEEAHVFEAEVLAPAHANQALLERAFRAGKLSLPTLILLQNQLLDAEMGYWNAWQEQRVAFAELEAATGSLIPAITTIAATEAVR